MYDRGFISKYAKGNSYMTYYVNKIEVIMFYVCTGEFLIMTPTESLLKIMDEKFAYIVRSEPEQIAGYSVLGRMLLKDYKYWTIIDEQKSKDFVKKSIEKFWTLLAEYGQENGFLSFLFEISEYTCGIDLKETKALEYWWLLGDRKEIKNLKALPMYEKKYGLFLDKKENRLPIYTSNFYAEIGASLYKEKYGINLFPANIQCLGCFLQGIAQVYGNMISEMVFLNDVWKINYFVSDYGDYKTPNHFTIKDDLNGKEFLLAGCIEQNIDPRWVEMEKAIESKVLNNKIRKW